VCEVLLYNSQQARSFQLVTQGTLLSPSLHLLSQNQICLRLTEHDTARRVGTSSRQSEGPPYPVHRPIQCVLQQITIKRVHAQHNAPIAVSIDPGCEGSDIRVMSSRIAKELNIATAPTAYFITSCQHCLTASHRSIVYHQIPHSQARVKPSILRVLGLRPPRNPVDGLSQKLVAQPLHLAWR
jgi:hypothetical protein